MAQGARSDAQALDAQVELQQLRELNRSLQDRIAALQAAADVQGHSHDGEASRSHSERKYVDLFDGIHDAVLIADPQRGIVDVNPAFTAMFGYELDELRGRTTSCLYSNDADYERMGAALREFYGTSRFTLTPTYRRKNGEAFRAESNVYYQKNADGHVTGFIALIQDISGRLKAERDLQQAYAELKETDRYKDEFLSIISHELRTPLNFIMGFASILGDEIPGPINEQQRNCIERILNGSDRMLALVNNLLDMSRIAAGQFQIAPARTLLSPLVDETLSTLVPQASEKGVTVEAVVDAPEPVWMDGDRILQVLTNLVNNAIKFTPRGGRIQVRAHVQEEVLRVEVGDDGIGITPEDLPKLFTRFRQLDMSATRTSGGTGLGLSIVKTIVETHGGRVGVDSTPGEGSTFWFELPTGPATQH